AGLYKSPIPLKIKEDAVARRCALAMLVIVVLSAPPAEASESILVRHPTISRDRIVFCYAGDLWSTARVGGDAVRLTAGVGEKCDPYFSPDGKWLALSGDYCSNPDLFIRPAEDGDTR